MISRILEIIKLKQLSSSQFAEEIGVQRSSISHLLSGRNKPSLEFIQRILKRYPDLNPDYLMFGSGEIFRTESMVKPNEAVQDVPGEEKMDVKQVENESNEGFKPARKRVVIEDSGKVERKIKQSEDTRLERIVYFYKDKTFREYFPE